MKTTVVPAQITTVEDKVAGNLSFTQLLLMATPVFLDGLLFVLLPPLFKPTAPKLLIGSLVAVICLVLAIRIKGKLVLNWLIIITRYNLRPQYYIFDKNDLHLRETEAKTSRQPMSQIQEVIDIPAQRSPLFIPTSEMVRLETAVADPQANFQFKATKGGLRVYIREIKEETV